MADREQLMEGARRLVSVNGRVRSHEQVLVVTDPTMRPVSWASAGIENASMPAATRGRPNNLRGVALPPLFPVNERIIRPSFTESLAGLESAKSAKDPRSRIQWLIRGHEIALNQQV